MLNRAGPCLQSVPVVFVPTTIAIKHGGRGSVLLTVLVLLVLSSVGAVKVAHRLA